MPNIGDIIHSQEIGIKQRCLYRWSGCPDCGIERWIRKNCSKDMRCAKCASKNRFNKHYNELRSNGIKFCSSKELRSPYGKQYTMYYDQCSNCGKELWRQKATLGKLCQQCSAKIDRVERMLGANNPCWKGGRSICQGYISVHVYSDSPYYSMRNKATRMVLEHRLIVAQSLGRCLEKWEVVHHKDGNRSNNDINNLELLPNASSHTPFTMMQSRIYKLERITNELECEIKEAKKRITIIEAENELLKQQLAISV